MADWIDIARWSECERMARPGYVFEVANGAGQSLFTPCVQALPTPWDWTSAPVRFRLVAEGTPRRSQPIPPPQGR